MAAGESFPNADPELGLEAFTHQVKELSIAAWSLPSSPYLAQTYIEDLDSQQEQLLAHNPNTFHEYQRRREETTTPRQAMFESKFMTFSYGLAETLGGMATVRVLGPIARRYIRRTQYPIIEE